MVGVNRYIVPLYYYIILVQKGKRLLEPTRLSIKNEEALHSSILLPNPPTVHPRDAQ